MSIKSAEERPAATSSGFVYITIGLLGLVVVGWRSAPRFSRVALVAAVLLSFGKFIGLFWNVPSWTSGHDQVRLGQDFLIVLPLTKLLKLIRTDNQK